MMTSVARLLHQAHEPYHGMIYFVPEGPQQYAAIGLQRGRMGYFASRAAAFGAVGAQVVIATFFNFHPDLVRSVIPAAWELATPTDVLAARLGAVDGALRRMLGAQVDSAEVAAAAVLTRRAAEAATAPGRPMYAAHSQLPWPHEPHLQLWHAATLLREFRGDGHIAALVEQDIGPSEVLVIHAAMGSFPNRKALQSTRAWSDEEWTVAEDALRSRGWLDAAGVLTETGRAHRQAIEERTDALAERPWSVLTDAEQQQLIATVGALSKTIVAAGTFSFR